MTESPRYLIAKRIADWIVEHKFTTPFGGDITRSDDRRAYCILFARPRTLDGLVRVFGPKFITVDTQGSLGQGRQIYDSVENALAFMQAAFVDHDRDAADRVPVRTSKGGRRNDRGHDA